MNNHIVVTIIGGIIGAIAVAINGGSAAEITIGYYAGGALTASLSK